MIENAFSWAAKNGLTRRNIQHGEEEAKLVLQDDFEVKNVEGESTQQTHDFDVEVFYPHWRCG